MAQQRYSRQRQAILEAVKSSRAHPTAEMVHQAIRAEMPSVSLGTVYRNLKVLSASGEIKPLYGDANNLHYDGRCDDHPHLVCTHCHQVYDMPDAWLERLGPLDEVSTQHEIDFVDITFYGVCEHCRTNKTKEVESL
jgi:Fur family peroxide stress response transcriptional regulator